MAMDNNGEAIYDRTHVCERIKVFARPSLRPPTVLDLPFELLSLIFNYVKFGTGNPPSEYPPYRHNFWEEREDELQDIQNIRLTCHRFCNIGSRLLINYVQIGLQSESLRHLQEIASHPLIRQGIRTVSMSLRFYHSSLANSFKEFSAVCCKELDSDIWSRRRHDTYIIERATDIKAAWERARSGTDVDEALQASHAMYQKRYEDQRLLLADGLFVQGVATALAQMPAIKALKFNDHSINYGPCDEWPDLVSNPTELAIHYTQPFGTRLGHNHGLDSELPLNIIPEVLGALPALGVTLQHLQIYIAEVYNTHLLVQDSQNRENLRLLAKQLSYIDVVIRRIVRYRRPPGYVSPSMAADMAASIYQFLSAILDTESLETISLLLEEPYRTEPDFPSIGPALNGPKRPKLKSLDLCNISIHAHELQLLVDSLRPALRFSPDEEQVRVGFYQSHLLSGSLANVDTAMNANPYIDWRRTH